MINTMKTELTGTSGLESGETFLAVEASWPIILSVTFGSIFSLDVLIAMMVEDMLDIMLFIS